MMQNASIPGTQRGVGRSRILDSLRTLQLCVAVHLVL